MMKKAREISKILGGLFVAGLMMFGIGLRAENESSEKELNIDYKDIPANIQKAANVFFSTGSIKGAKTILEEDTVKYEVEGTIKGIETDVIFSSKGDIIDVEREINKSELPELALKAVSKDYPGIKIKRVESVERHYYEVEGVVNGEKREFKVFSSGDIEDVNENDK